MKSVRLLTAILALCFFEAVQAQPRQILEEVAAVVGENVILKSEWEVEYLQVKDQYPDFKGDLKCEILNQLVLQKLLLHKAELDSIEISEEMVDYELDRKIVYFTAQIGDEARLEKYLGKSIIEYKEEMKPKLKQQMQVQEVQKVMLDAVKVTPTEVKKYFDKIPNDSLPLFGTEVELGQIVMVPKPNQLAKDYAYETLKKYREDILAGRRDFELTAKSFSEDPGSAANGGELGYFKRGQMVSAFEAMAFKLKPDSVSPIIETQYGYHILKLIDRKGEKINVRHILIKPTIITKDLQNTEKFLNDLIALIKIDSISFCKAASKYSEDEMTKANCGFFTDPNVGANRIEIELLDQDVVLQVQKMKPGEFSKPTPIQNPDGSTAYRILYLKSETKPHRANLREDYQKIQAFALEQKKQEAMAEWAEKFKKNVYIHVEPGYTDCKEMKRWIKTN
ncbi:MAG: peptidylprolyl isomerase [Flavobacteriales bacterium]|nr:peptidylprolyl isomerase [Flavobacteriales bacterium]